MPPKSRLARGPPSLPRASPLRSFPLSFCGAPLSSSNVHPSTHDLDKRLGEAVAELSAVEQVSEIPIGDNVPDSGTLNVFQGHRGVETRHDSGDDRKGLLLIRDAHHKGAHASDAQSKSRELKGSTQANFYVSVANFIPKGSPRIA